MLGSRKTGSEILGFTWKRTTEALAALWLAKLTGARVDVFLMETLAEFRQLKSTLARDRSLVESRGDAFGKDTGNQTPRLRQLSVLLYD